jgi:hypothetical protein
MNQKIIQTLLIKSIFRDISFYCSHCCGSLDNKDSIDINSKREHIIKLLKFIDDIFI